MDILLVMKRSTYRIAIESAALSLSVDDASAMATLAETHGRTVEQVTTAILAYRDGMSEDVE